MMLSKRNHHLNSSRRSNMKKVNSHLARALLIAILLSALPLYVALATPTSFQWGSYNSSGLTTYGVYDTDNITVLQTGDLAQLIWAGPNGVIDPPDPTTGAPTADDILLDSTTVQNAGSLPPTLRNKGYILLKTYTFDTADPQSGGVIYIRAWNNTTPTTATAYGNSLTGTLVGGLSYNALRWHTDTSPTAVSLVDFQASAGNRSWVWAAIGLALAAVVVTGSLLVRRYARSKA
jgi:hypothetical protein